MAGLRRLRANSRAEARKRLEREKFMEETEAPTVGELLETIKDYQRTIKAILLSVPNERMEIGPEALEECDGVELYGTINRADKTRLLWISRTTSPDESRLI